MNEFNQLPEEYVKPLQLIFNLLAKCGIYFFDPNMSCWYTNTIRPMIIKTCVSVYFMLLTVYLSRIFRGAMEIYELAYIFPVYTVCFQALLRGMNTITKKDQLTSLILQLGAIWRTEKLNKNQIKKKDDFFKKINISYIACYRVSVIASWQYMLAPLCQTLFRRLVLKQESRMLLPFACSFPFDTENNWTAYTMAYSFELFSMLGVIYYYIGSETLMITLTGLVSTEFSLLQEDFIDAKPVCQEVTNNDYEIREITSDYSLKHMIKKHQKLIKLAEQLDNIFNTLIFVNLSSTTIIISFFAVAAKVARGTVDMVNNFFAVLTLMVPLFNLCYFSDLLRHSSSGIADSAYNSIWYKGDKKYKRLLWFVIRRAHLQPSSLTSMKYKQISLSTFNAILSTTWSYFSLASSLLDDIN